MMAGVGCAGPKWVVQSGHQAMTPLTPGHLQCSASSPSSPIYFVMAWVFSLEVRTVRRLRGSMGEGANRGRRHGAATEELDLDDVGREGRWGNPPFPTSRHQSSGCVTEFKGQGLLGKVSPDKI